MLDLSMLSNLSVQAPKELAAKAVRGNRDCTDGDFKVTRSGNIYFSEKFRKELAVEGGMKFFDVADGTLMNFGEGNNVPFMFVNIVDMATPKASIQGKEGKVAFVNKYLKPMATKLYEIDWDLETSVSFTLLRDKTIEAKFGFIPRVNKKGEADYVKRENASFIPCVPTSLLAASEPKQDTQLEIPFVEEQSINIE